MQITRQHYRGRRWHVVHDPSSNQFYRLSPIAYDYICTLDGARSVEEAWKISMGKFGDASPTQNEVIELLSQLYNTNLLAVDHTPETDQLLARGRERTKKRVQQQVVGIMYLRIKLFNPDRLLTAVEPFFRPLLNRWGLLAWAGFVLWSLLSVLPHWDRLAKGIDQYLIQANPSNYGWMMATFIAIKLFHELGHGVMCKRFGGQVPEFGTMLLVLLPSPYVDASASWAFSSRWQRCAVGAGGMIFELFLASIAAHVWLNAGGGEGSLAAQVAYYAMISASVSTLLFNANPLMRFDGYFILADLLETPNLMQRSSQMLTYMVQKHVFRLKNLRPPTTQPSERVILIVYGVLSGIYRVVLFFSITLYIMGQFFAIGLLLAIWTAGAWFLMPIGKLAHWLASSSSIAEHRTRTIFATLGMIALAAGLVGLLPLPDWRRATGVVETTARTGVFFETEGFVVEANVRPGTKVRKGDVIATLINPDLDRGLATVNAQLAEAALRLQDAMNGDSAGSVDVVRKQLRVLKTQKAEVEHRIAGLVVRAPQDGAIVSGDPQGAVGAYVRRGEAACEIVDTEHLRIAATLAQGEGAWFNELPREQYVIQMRYASRVGDVVLGGKAWSPQAAQKELPHPALGYRGGGSVEVDGRDEKGRVAKRGVFTVYIEPDPAAPPGAPGERVHLRFTLPSKPLLSQVVDRLQKLIQGRVNL